MRLERILGLAEMAVSAIILLMIKNRYIKCFAAVAAVCALAHAAAASVSTRVVAPLPEYADNEASAGAALPAAGEKDRTLRLMLAFRATPTNNVEVALGAALGGDSLDPDGTAVIVGWDSGGWFITGDRLRQTFTAAAADPSAAGPRMLTVNIRLGPGWGEGAPASRVAIFEERPGAGTPSRTPVVFNGLEAGTLLSWLAPSGWDTLSVTSRGGAENASAEAKLFMDGSAVIVR